MNNYKFLLILFITNFSCAQDHYSLIIENSDPSLNSAITEGIEEIFENVYPKLVQDFNPSAQEHVTIKIDTAYDGVAYAHQGAITISSDWLHKKPEDLDLVTHELMHLVQAYPNDSGPGWLTEGIADYVRHVYALDNERAGWSLTPFNPSQSYKNSYRITARFLVWLTQNYDEDLVIKLDEDLRTEQYTPETWDKYTGKSIDELWLEYSKNPKI
ncbi:MAG: basic secretory protein-like protein [Bacteroidota bacterium]|nr:basic secretory protein-like protein [Bacteroidota bacterium]